MTIMVDAATKAAQFSKDMGLSCVDWRNEAQACARRKEKLRCGMTARRARRASRLSPRDGLHPFSTMIGKNTRHSAAGWPPQGQGVHAFVPAGASDNR